MSKAQNPNNNFYFNTQKCIGNTAHSIQDQNMKKNGSNLLLLYRKWRKGNIRLFKKIAVSAFFFTKSNIYCINWKMLEDLAFLWITELIFRTASHLCCMESTNFWHLWTGIPAQDDCTTYHISSAFLGFCLKNSIFYVTPQVFYWIKVRGLGWPL